MNVLVACEESQRVCMAFRERGHNAFSCDIQPCSGGHPEWHIRRDVREILNPVVYKNGVSRYGIPFVTECGERHDIQCRWDFIIAHPPCTDLAGSGARHFAKKRQDGRQRNSVEFFCCFLVADCHRIVIENPVGIMSGNYVKEHFPDLAEKYGLPLKPMQIIQPYQFGDHARKATCLFSVGDVKPLVPDNIVDHGEIVGNGFSVGASLNYARDENGKILSWNDPRTAKIRSKTHPGIARAMAEQWG